MLNTTTTLLSSMTHRLSTCTGPVILLEDQATLNVIHMSEAPQADLLRREQRGHDQADPPVYVVVRDNVIFHWVREYVGRFLITSVYVFLPPVSPCLNPKEEYFPAWWWKVFDQNPQNPG